MKMVYTVYYFINGTSNAWKTGITSKNEAEALAYELGRKFPRWDMSIGYGVDQSTCAN